MLISGPSVQIIIEMEARPAPHSARRNRFLLRSERKSCANIPRPCRSISPRDEYLDAPVLGLAVGRRIGRDRNFRPFAVDLDAVRLRQSLRQQRADRLGALDREMPIGREPHALDRLAVGMPDDLDEPFFLIEQLCDARGGGLESLANLGLAGLEQGKIAKPDYDYVRRLSDGDALVGELA